MNHRFENIILLNLPNKERITRRYMCSYASPVSLFPPYELLSVGGIIKAKLSKKVTLIDAIADNKSLVEVIREIESVKPDLIITITGFESYSDDLLAIKSIKAKLGNTQIFIIGHYPTLFPKETLTESNADFILHGEPDLSVIELISALEASESVSKINGISYLANGTYYTSNSNTRISNIDTLPLPAHELLFSDSYSEPLLPKPYAVIQSARGCPYQCNFCVKSFGSKLTEKSPERIVEEIKFLVETRNIKSFRFTDDTFSLNPKRVIKICQQIVDAGLNYLEWVCLSRVDTINEEMLYWMKKAGCKRIYFGVESGSTKVLESLNKKTDLDASVNTLLMVKRYGIQTSGFFMIGVPGETIEDIDMSIEYAIKAKLDFIAIGKFTPYPGTQFFDKFKENIEFNIFPYRLSLLFKEQDQYDFYEKYFYKKFYLRVSYMTSQVRNALSRPIDSMQYFSKFMSYSFGKGLNALNHIQTISD